MNTNPEVQRQLLLTAAGLMYAALYLIAFLKALHAEKKLAIGWQLLTLPANLGGVIFAVGSSQGNFILALACIGAMVVDIFRIFKTVSMRNTAASVS